MTATTTPPTTPAGHADTAAEAVRALNHATQRCADITPPDVASTLGSLALLAHRQGQAYTQLARALTRAMTAYDVYDDTGGDPATTVALAEHHLRQAAGLTDQIGHQLDRAHAAANHLGYRTPQNDDYDADTDPDTDPVLW